jgi:arginase family enzyme
VLDPKEIPGHGLPAEGGPSVSQLGAAFEIMFRYPKVGGMGIAGYPVGRDPDRVTLKSVYSLIEYAIKGVRTRSV